MRGRSSITDYEYGVVSYTNDYNNDTPVYAIIECNENGDVIYEDYKPLEEYLEKKFIPNYILSKTEGENKKYYIRRADLLKLNLSELEIIHTFHYLESKNIYVIGRDISFAGEFPNYIHVPVLENSKFRYDGKKVLELFREYERTKDRRIREEIILNTMFFVKHFSFLFSIYYKVPANELESYAFEGLIRAIDSFNPYSGYEFSTYVKYPIYQRLIKGVNESKGIKSYRGLSLMTAKAKVEHKYSTTIREDNSIIKEIVSSFTSNENDYDNISDYLRILFDSDSLDVESLNQVDDTNESEDEIIERFYYDYLRSVIFNSNQLTDKEREMIIIRFGFDDGVYKTLAETGRILNKSREATRQNEENALRKLERILKRY